MAASSAASLAAFSAATAGLLGLALGLQARFFGAPGFFLGLLLGAQLFALAPRFGDRFQLRLLFLVFGIPRLRGGS